MTGAILDHKSLLNGSWKTQTPRALPSTQLKNFLPKWIRISCFAFHYYLNNHIQSLGGLQAAGTGRASSTSFLD